MILILSSDDDDSTCHVIDWLIYFGIKFIRINGCDQFSLSNFILSNDHFICRLKNTKTQEVLDLNKISKVWYRRGNIKFQESSNLSNDFANILTFSKKEYKILHNFVMNFLEKLPRLDSYFRSSMNKLEVLYTAKSVGLSIPDTYLFQGKIPVTGPEKYITKSIFEVYNFQEEGGTYFTPTSLVDQDTIDNPNLSFGLSQLQTLIEKECDIRIFYLRGKLYSMAIMSQNNEKSQIDFRSYPMDPPNRSFPIKIPEKTADKIRKLMQNLNLDSGSIDLILDKKGNFVFLEVNPVGQFGMTSTPCNYMLEMEIAKDLISIH